MTIEDIVEEIIGEFTTQAPGGAGIVAGASPTAASSCRRHGAAAHAEPPARAPSFPLDGPKTLNGLIVEHLGEIPDAGTVVELDGQLIEILQTQDRAVKVVRLLPPVGRGAPRLYKAPVERASSTAKFYASGITRVTSIRGRGHATCLRHMTHRA